MIYQHQLLVLNKTYEHILDHECNLIYVSFSFKALFKEKLHFDDC